jgi:ribonucleoside-diphosphate reductase beta chain
MSSVFQQKKKSHLESTMFYDEGVDIARYDQVKYPELDKITDKQLGFFWRPEEIDVSKDKSDFRALTEHEQHIFTSNLKRQILLDSVQGRGPTETLMPVASLPELEPLVMAWTFMETIHSRSYTHIIRNVYPNPSKVFDEMLDIEEIVDCAKDISRYYDECIQANSWYNLLGEGKFNIAQKGMGIKSGIEVDINLYELKKKLWLALNSINILEGVRFYVSFACSWAFAELKKMEGNAKIIKFIARDENTHLAASSFMIKTLPKDDPDFARIKQECQEEVIQMFVDAVNQEKQWADYLFKDGSMIGLNARLLYDYIEWIANKRMKAIAVTSPYSVPQSNPLPWTEKWIGGGNVQVAPQETEISSYVIGGVKQDLDDNTFKGLSL